MSELSVPQTILNHLYTGKVAGYSSAVQACVAWGAMVSGQIDHDVKGRGTLKLQVHATLFKGQVRIEAKPNVPTYDLFFENYDGKTGNLVIRAFIQNVKPEHIAQVIDQQLEGEYKEPAK